MFLKYPWIFFGNSCTSFFVFFFLDENSGIFFDKKIFRTFLDIAFTSSYKYFSKRSFGHCSMRINEYIIQFGILIEILRELIRKHLEFRNFLESSCKLFYGNPSQVFGKFFSASFGIGFHNSFRNCFENLFQSSFETSTRRIYIYSFLWIHLELRSSISLYQYLKFFFSKNTDVSSS